MLRLVDIHAHLEELGYGVCLGLRRMKGSGVLDYRNGADIDNNRLEMREGL